MSKITTRRKLTALESQIRKKYTRLRYGTLRLVIDQQQFDIRVGEAKEWYRDMLAIAVARLIQDTKNSLTR